MTRAEMLAIDRRWAFALIALFLVLAVLSLGDWPYFGVCLLLAGHSGFWLKRAQEEARHVHGQ